MQNPVYQDQQENSKMEKIQKKPGFFKESALGFCPPRSKNKKIHQRHLLTLNENKKKKPAFRDSFWFLYERLWGYGT